MFVEGCIVVMDVDFLGELVEERGLSDYEPNAVTGYLTVAVESLAREHGGVVVYGLDYERGTEEAVIEFPLKTCSELEDALERIELGVKEAGASISTVCMEGLVLGRRAKSRREAFRGTPWREATYKRLLELKRRKRAKAGRSSP